MKPLPANCRFQPLPSQVAWLVLGLFCLLTQHAAGQSGPTSTKPPRWTSSRISGSPLPPAPYSTERVFPALRFEQPVALTTAPDSGRLWVGELDGKIYSFLNRPDCASADLAMDLRQHVEGMKRLYGLTFSPQFGEDRYCYVCYVLDENNPQGTRVSRFEVSRDEPPRLIPGSERTLLTWRSGGHNGGCVEFGPNGYLYISTGDGGPAFPPDPLNSGQDVGSLLSAILRIDVQDATAERPYRIPVDNPFCELPGARPEIWCYGLRNPWKMSFDTETGDLWVGDVGWELWEMVYRVQRGANYGWSLTEGPQPVHRERLRGPTPIVPPTVAHSHIESRSITGGFVYRGDRLPELRGAYVYGDYVTGKVWAVRHDGSRITWQQELTDSPLQIICFGTDSRQELYLVDYVDGTLHRLVGNPDSGVNQQFPQRLSETGLFSDVPSHQLAPGVLPYTVAAAPWEDGATAQRSVGLPHGEPLTLHTSTDVQIGYIKGTWKFPRDGVLVKTLSLKMRCGDSDSSGKSSPDSSGDRSPESSGKGSRRVETQVLHFDGDQWRGYSYVWNEQQTDAVLAPPEGVQLSLDVEDASELAGPRKHEWRVASRSECLLCHTTRAGTVHAFHPEQLNQTVQRDQGQENQLAWLHRIGALAEPAATDRLPLVDPGDETADLDRRARAYLHVNCAHCHRRGGGGTAALDVQYHLPLAATNLISRPTQGTFGMAGAEVVAPGDPFRSVLLYRMAKLGPGRMPHFGSQRVDRDGVHLMRRWIESLAKGDVRPAAELSATGTGAESGTAGDAQHRRIVDTLARLRAVEESSTAWREAAEQLLAVPSGALALLLELDDRVGQPPPEIRSALLRQAANATDDRIADLYQRFLPAEQRRKQLGTAVDFDAVLSVTGEPSRGRQLLLAESGLQCRNCHRIGEVGHELGPDLTRIGVRYNRQQLLQSILQPSKDIDPKYVTYLVETKDGKLLTGLLVSRDARQVVLRDASRREVTVATEEIELIAPQQQSLMPELLLRAMTVQQVADVLAYLESCR